MASIGAIFLLLPLTVSFLLLSSFRCDSPQPRKALEVGIGIGIDISGGESPPAVPDIQPSDFVNIKQYEAYLVIQSFKRSITCDPSGVTQSWVGPRPCEYRGFFCATPPDSPGTPTVASVDLNGYNLSAPTIAGFLDKLPDLAVFHANSNSFSGGVPDLSGLSFLYELDLSNNLHTGAFPAAAALPLHNLLFLDLRFNLFAGAVPSSLFALPGVDVLFLNDNGFDQPLPENVGVSPAGYLSLANNGFTGPIPPSIGDASKTLIEVLFLNNRLSGCLPQEIGLLARATVFDAGFNQITGSLPWSLGCLLQVEQLSLADNLLYGVVPEVVCRLAKYGNLRNLSLSGNYFTALGPACWGLISTGVLDVRRNCVLGLPEQRPVAECARFLLWSKPHCPLSHYIPCSLPQCSSKPVRARAPTAERAAARPRYVTYEALHQPPRH